MDLINPLWETLEQENEIDRNEIIDTISGKLDLNKLNLEELKLILINPGTNPNQEQEILNDVNEFEREDVLQELLLEKYKQKVFNIKHIFNRILVFFQFVQDSEFTDEEFNNILPKLEG